MGLSRQFKAFLIALVCLITMPWASLDTVHADQSSLFFSQTGFGISDDGQGSFLSAFDRFGGVKALGYPDSVPYGSGGFEYQGFQRAILQWRPDLGKAVLANTFDWLSEQGKDGWLDSIGIPRPIADSGGTWNQVVAEHESWMTEPAIAQAYRAGGGMDRYGLPQSRPERRGPFIVQRFQRVAFQLWVDQVPGMPAPGSVVGILAGDLAKQAGIIPAAATVYIPMASKPSQVGGGSGLSIVDSADAEQLALSLINQTRASYGLPLVTMNSALQTEARAYSTEMAQRNFFDHTDPDGVTFLDRLEASGVKNWSIGLENLGWGQGYATPSDSVRANHQEMMAETPPNDGHRVNILNSQARRVGIGVVQRSSDGRVYYTCEFTD